VIRRATEADADAIADVLTAARAAQAWFPRLHSPEETRSFVLDRLLPRLGTLAKSLHALQRIDPSLSKLQEAHDAAQVCLQARKRGLLTRPIRNVIVLMPPLCITTDQLTEATEAIRASIIEVCGPTSAPKNK